jgi:ATP-dependent DNA helicase RecG
LSYLPLAIDKETLEANGRSTEEQMASLRFYDLKENCPTNAGILVFGINPLFQLPGAYIQYVKFEGEEMISSVVFEKEFSGALISELGIVDDFIKNNIIKERPVRTGSFQEKKIVNYPYWALRELVMNAIMHRSYETNSPIYIYEFSDRIEIHNSGGLYGDVNASNFPNASGYRNVVLAETLKRLGYVNRFNYGVKRAIHELEINGNGQPEFDLTLTTKFKVTVPINMIW